MTGGAGGWGIAVEEQLKRSLQKQKCCVYEQMNVSISWDTGLQDGTTGESE